jgi:uncharacterized protein (TIGR03437 family)
MGWMALVSGSALAQCLVNLPLQIGGPSTLPNMEVGVEYRYQFQTSGGEAPYRYSIYWRSQLPSGIELSEGGELTGRPTAARVNETFNIAVIDRNALRFGLCTFQVSTVANRLAISSTMQPRATVGVVYTTALQASGGVAPYRYEIVSGSYPPGLSGFSNGTISGTPTTPGTFVVRLRVVDGNGNSATGDVTIVVEGQLLRIETNSLPGGEVGVAYAATLRVVGSAAASFMLANGALPGGLTLAANGAITGTPTAAGDFNFVVRAVAGSANVDAPFVIRVVASRAPLSLVDWPGARFGEGVAVSLQIPTIGGNGNLQFRLLEGVIPAGLVVSERGLMTGTARNSGTFVQRWRVVDSSGAGAERVYNLVVDGARSYPDAVAGQRYSQRELTTAAVRFSVDPSSKLPLGLRLEPDGTLVGTPFAAGEYTFLLRAEGGVAAPYRLNVVAPASELEVDSLDLPAATRGRAYRQTLLALPAATSARLIEGELPTGLSWNGVTIEGTPSRDGYWEFLVDLRSGTRSTSRRYAIAVHSLGLPQVDAVLNSASYQAGGVAAGEILTLFGANLDGVRALVDGVMAPVLYSTPTQTSVIVPFGVGLKSSAVLTLQRSGWESYPFRLRVVAAKPGIYTVSGNGLGAAAALNQDGSLNTEANGAAAGSVVVLYGTGLGPIDGAAVDGAAATGAALARVFGEGQLLATVNGVEAKILYAGAAPGLIHGAAQVNLELPAGVGAGRQRVRLSARGRSSNEVEVWLR